MYDLYANPEDRVSSVEANIIIIMTVLIPNEDHKKSFYAEKQN